MSKLQAESRTSGAQEDIKSSDNRLDVTSRSDGRGYYNSRDQSESYVLPFNDANCTTADHIVHLQNTKTDGKHLVVRSIGINSDSASSWDVVTVTGTAGGGAVAATPINLNFAGQAKSATVTANTVVDSDNSPISGLTDVSEFDHVNVVAGGHEEFRFEDQVRLGEGQAIAIRCKSGTGVSGFGVIYFYFESGTG